MNCFKSAVAFFFLFFLQGTSIGNGQQGISYNGLGLCDVVAFKAQKFNNPPKLIRCTQLNFCTSATYKFLIKIFFVCK